MYGLHKFPSLKCLLINVILYKISLAFLNNNFFIFYCPKMEHFFKIKKYYRDNPRHKKDAPIKKINKNFKNPIGNIK